MLFFGKKEKEVEKLIIEHIELVKQTLSKFSSLVDDYLNRDKQFKEEAHTIHTLERKADSIRREVAMKLSKGAFLPIYREDYVVLLELIDKVANKVESASDLIVLTRPRIPDFLVGGIKRMVAATLECFGPLEDIYELFQKNLDDVLATAAKVEKQEQEVDKIQWDLIKAVFKSELSMGEKMLLKELIDEMAAISDRIENVSDRFEIMVVKRSI